MLLWLLLRVLVVIARGDVVVAVAVDVAAVVVVVVGIWIRGVLGGRCYC